jgi:hypothetical protein
MSGMRFYEVEDDGSVKDVTEDVKAIRFIAENGLVRRADEEPPVVLYWPLADEHPHIVEPKSLNQSR